MRFIELRHLRGPNIYTTSPVTIARLELDDLTHRETTEFGGFAERLTTLLPGLAGHHCAAGRPGGFLDAMARGTYFGHVTEHVALELSGLAGRHVHLGRTMWAGTDGRYDVMTQSPQDEPAESTVPEALLLLAMRVVHDVLAGVTPDFRPELDRIAGVCERERLGVSTAAIAAAARQRGIPVRRVGSRSLLRLGYGCHRRLTWAALTNQASAVGVDIAADKQLAKQLLADAGVPVAPGLVAWSAPEAQAALAGIGGPVVIKPLDGRQGASMTIGVRTAAEAEAAYQKAAAASDAVLVEALVPGTDYRVLVIDGQVAAAAQLRPASVTGDGASTIGQLVAAANADPRRGAGHSRELTKITLDADAMSHLDSLGLDDHSVPAAGQVVSLRRNANLSTGGTSRDVTDLVHPEVADMCRRAAAAAGLDVCGIDLRLADITAPVHDPTGHGPAQPCAVLELNACPGLRMHLSPAEGTPRDVAAAVVDSLYPPGVPTRIPIVSVTGTNGKTSTTRLISQVLAQAGLRVGMSCTDGVFVRGALVYEADASGPRSAEMVLDDPTVEAAVLETARGGIVRRGLGYDEADVAVVTNISADHLGDDGIADFGELVAVKALVAEQIREGGSVVLNADDPAAAGLADRPAVRARTPVIRLFSMTPGNPVLERHRAAGGSCYEVVDGQLTETEAGERRPLMAVADLPGSFAGRAAHVVADTLAAVAACRALGVTGRDIARGLAGFDPAADNPGRASFFRAGASPVVVDYGHNAAAMEATGRFLREVFGTTPVAAVTLPGDRQNDLVVQTAAAVAAWFGPVVLYEDSDKRGRQTGEMLDLVETALRAAEPGVTVQRAENPADALRAALRLAGGGPVLFVYEKLALARDALTAVGAQPWPEAETGLPTPGVGGGGGPAGGAGGTAGRQGPGGAPNGSTGNGSTGNGSTRDGSMAGRGASRARVATAAGIVTAPDASAVAPSPGSGVVMPDGDPTAVVPDRDPTAVGADSDAAGTAADPDTQDGSADYGTLVAGLGGGPGC
ncbi:MAG TPA: cyanophycin synthetase [Streptosporangiaceae bacterium]|nr:cyanophycin synthetase [Streptosporangiaceae bacterium]